jgi:NADH-quinone oxidoreductase subunit D
MAEQKTEETTKILQNLERIPDSLPAAYNEFDRELTTLNLGPTHPATHGIFQNILQMDGEKIISGVPTIGYIHRASKRSPSAGLFTRSPRSPTG